MRNIVKGEVPQELIDEKSQIQFEKVLSQKKIQPQDCNIYRTVKDKLTELYKTKCCYCETKISGTEIEHFRPKNDYYWLVYSWDNLLPICSHCNKIKGKKFQTNKPKINSHNIVNVIQAQNLKQEYDIIEEPLLINPETDVITDETFVFEENGLMKSKEERFDFTIAQLKLNRPELLKHRKKLFDDLREKEDGLIWEEEDFVITKCKDIMKQLVKEAYNETNDYISLRKFLISFYRNCLQEQG